MSSGRALSIGAVCAAAAEATGLPEGTPVIAGMTDGCAAQLGAGALRPGSWNSRARHHARAEGRHRRSWSTTRSASSTPTARRTATGCPAARPAPAPACSPATSPAATWPRSTARAAAPRARGRPLGRTRWSRAASGSRSRRRTPSGFTARRAPADEADRYAAILQGVAFVERLCFDYLDLPRRAGRRRRSPSPAARRAQRVLEPAPRRRPRPAGDPARASPSPRWAWPCSPRARTGRRVAGSRAEMVAVRAR